MPTIRIPLTQGKFTTVDFADIEKALHYRWHAFHSSGRWWYARAWVAEEDKSKGTVFLHRYLLDAAPDELVDHKNGDGLLNTRENLRVATIQQNNANRSMHRNNTSGYKGVVWAKRERLWTAQIGHNYTNIHLGNFSNIEDAARAYDEAAVRLFGPFARTNFPVEQQERASG